MDGIKLLEEARGAGLVVKAVGEKLVIRGPRTAAVVAKHLLANKVAIMRLLTPDTTDRDASRANPEQIVPSVSVSNVSARDEWGFPLSRGDRVIDWPLVSFPVWR